MFNVYVPDPIYERLPKIYLLTALVLVATPLAQIKWMAVAALVIATMVTRHQRQIYREALRMREALKFRQNLEYESPYAIAETELKKTYKTGAWKSASLLGRGKSPQSAAPKASGGQQADPYGTVTIPTSGSSAHPQRTRVTAVRPQVRDPKRG